MATYGCSDWSGGLSASLTIRRGGTKVSSSGKTIVAIVAWCYDEAVINRARLLPHAPCTLANCYHMRRLLKQSATVCGARCPGRTRRRSPSVRGCCAGRAAGRRRRGRDRARA